MQWHDLCFAHWRVPAASLRVHLPDGLQLDTFDGSAWLGVVPFRMAGVRARCAPALPGLSAFPELNLRTYVTRDGRPGVWFFSLDAAHRLAVRTARRCWGLPYFDARMHCAPEGASGVRYSSERTHRGVVGATLDCRYRPIGPVFHSAPGSLEAFLTDRLCLYTRDRRGQLRRGEIEHAPWPLQRAEWSATECDMTRLLGIELRGEPESLLFARALHVRAWLPVVC